MRTLSYTVLPEDDNRLIKRVARSKIGISSHQLARAKALNTLCLNGESVHADHVVHAGDVIYVSLIDDENDFVITPENVPVNVLFEDDDIIVLDKEAPLATQSSPKQPDNTLENRMVYRYRDVENYVFRPVNRLDKGTSGLMCVAKHAHAQMKMSAQLHTPAFVREYLAIAEGAPNPPSGTIDAPIGKADGATVKREVKEGGKESVTHYETIKTNGNLSLIHLRLETGRTHQIRVHLKHIGCPVFGDFLYGEERSDLLAGRFALHSAYVRFTHPITGEVMEFSSPLPEALSRLMEE
ncbi:MAG: RluA family pseudouridine synthase [Clostridia bacterium]|nr:RluA family pseudouridine synthase [Clostridia bacterium]